MMAPAAEPAHAALETEARELSERHTGLTAGPRSLDSLPRVTTFRAPLHVSLPGAIAFVQAYQQQGAWLTIAELWAVPAVLRLASLGIV